MVELSLEKFYVGFVHEDKIVLEHYTLASEGYLAFDDYDSAKRERDYRNRFGVVEWKVYALKLEEVER